MKICETLRDEARLSDHWNVLDPVNLSGIATIWQSNMAMELPHVVPSGNLTWRLNMTIKNSELSHEKRINKVIFHRYASHSQRVYLIFLFKSPFPQGILDC